MTFADGKKYVVDVGFGLNAFTQPHPLESGVVLPGGRVAGDKASVGYDGTNRHQPTSLDSTMEGYWERTVDDKLLLHRNRVPPGRLRNH